MKKLFAFFFLFYAGLALADPLETWSDWSVGQPYVSKQVPPNAMIMRGIGTDAYYVLEVDPATGEIPVSVSGASISIDFSGPTGDPVPADAGFVGGVDPGGDLRGLSVDVDGRLQIDAVSDNDFAGNTGSPVPAEAAYMAGVNTLGNLEGLSIDASGYLEVAVATSTLPTGSATSANQVLEINLLTTIDSDTGTIATDTTAINGKTPALGQAAMAASVPVVIASDQTAIPVDITGDSTQGKGAADATTMRVTEGSRTYGDSFAQNYSSGNVTTAAWTQLIATTAADINLLCITDQSGQVMELGVGAAASESRIFLVAPGFSGCIPIRIASGSRVAVKAVSATASSGYLTISGLN